jgi:hypothetical protein
LTAIYARIARISFSKLLVSGFAIEAMVVWTTRSNTKHIVVNHMLLLMIMVSYCLQTCFYIGDFLMCAMNFTIYTHLASHRLLH